MSANNSDLNILNELDEIREASGPDQLRSSFLDLLEQDEAKAFSLLNDTNLHFCSLFVLEPSIDGSNRLNHLNERNLCSLELIRSVLKGTSSDIRSHSSTKKQQYHSALKWIVETGSPNDGFNNDYDEVLDKAYLLLTKEYQDTSVLPLLGETIFQRNQKGTFCYDLIWAFFESRNPQSLLHIAKHIRSSNPGDVELAHKLLDFIPTQNLDPRSDVERQYLYYASWIQENLPFMHYTGEAFQETSNPVPYVVSLEAKYLCKSISVDGGKPRNALRRHEYWFLERFKSLDRSTQDLLSTCSYFLYRQNRAWWNRWMQWPVTEQTKFAKTMLGG